MVRLVFFGTGTRREKSQNFDGQEEKRMLKAYTETAEKYGVIEIVLEGPSTGNPFTDQWVSGVFESISETKRTEGFYDGEGIYRIRCMPSFAEEYRCTIETSWGEPVQATVAVKEAEEGNHGPVRVSSTFHFSYDDGTVFYPVGTTCYVWHLQPETVREETYESLKKLPFNKIRFCIFPKHYDYNLREPEIYPFALREDAPWSPADFQEEKLKAMPRNELGAIPATVGDPEKVWDFARFNPAYFARIEQDIRRLGRMGIEADLILLHPYDRWGFCHLTEAEENFYLKYVVNRFSAFHNVWWSMANEYDLFFWKPVTQWEANAAVVCRQDPYRHLRSIHNCLSMYDHTRAWITHCSLQRIDTCRTAENTDIWRLQYGKPCVLDEIAYEGDIPYGWGNISGEEMTRRFWEACLRGGYGQHGETYLSDDDILWWSHGGKIKGESPKRIAFLKAIMEENGGYMEPVKGLFDETVATNVHPGSHPYKPCFMYYYGANRPSGRPFFYDGKTVEVELIDTWNMTVTHAGRYSGSFNVEFPRKPYMAARVTIVQ